MKRNISKVAKLHTVCDTLAEEHLLYAAMLHNLFWCKWVNFPLLLKHPVKVIVYSSGRCVVFGAIYLMGGVGSSPDPLAGFCALSAHTLAFSPPCFSQTFPFRDLAATAWWGRLSFWEAEWPSVLPVVFSMGRCFSIFPLGSGRVSVQYIPRTNRQAHEHQGKKNLQWL